MRKRILSFLLALVMVLGMVPAVAPAARAETTASSRMESILSEMTLEEKITQMMMVDFRKWGQTADKATDLIEMNDEIRQILKNHNFGGVLLFSNNIKETKQTFDLVTGMQAAATANGGIAMLISSDHEGGSVYRLGSGTALPGNMALGATYAANGTRYAYEAGKIIGSELGVLGINANLAPIVDVNNNANNIVVGKRSYGDDAVMVGELASAVIAGMAEYNVIGAAKHFPGHGDTATDAKYGLPIVDKSLSDLKKLELKPYEVAIEQGLEMIMVAHILYPQLESDRILSNETGEMEALPATMSDDIITDLLKGDMGFDGIVITDAMNMAGITRCWNPTQAAIVAINAGVDMLVMPTQLYCQDDLLVLENIIKGIKLAVQNGEIPMSRINDAVTRILTVKENRGILDYNAEDYTLENAQAVVGCEANREMEREMSAAAVTVVKNDGVLPLDVTKDSKVLMLCPYANERAQMIMGWNRAKEAGIIPDGAQVDYYRFNSTTISQELQEKLDWADTYIILSEVPSTSRMGYKHWLSAMPNTLCDYAAANGKSSVIISVDKPYDVQMYANANAIMAVYGCKGSSVDPMDALENGVVSSAAAYGPNIIAGVEVALGTFGASGKLPLNIPVYDSEENYYLNDLSYELGQGRTYAAKEPVSQANPFIDVKEGDFFYDPVMWAVQKGITKGVDDTHFGPDQICNRGQVVTFLWRAAGKPEPKSSTNPFVDVKTSDYFYKPVLWALENNITKGVDDTHFGPDQTCNRGQVVTFLWRAAGKPEPTSSKNPFVDVKSSDFFYKPVLWALEKNITKGVDDTHFGPDQSCNRSQVVTFLYRTYGK